MAQGMCAPGLSCIFVFLVSIGFVFLYVTHKVYLLLTHINPVLVFQLCMIQELLENLGRPGRSSQDFIYQEGQKSFVSCSSHMNCCQQKIYTTHEFTYILYIYNIHIKNKFKNSRN